MLKFSVCIEMIFTKMSIEERIRQVARSGARAFEFWGWQDKDIDLIGRAARANKLKVGSFIGSWTPLVDSSKKKDFVADVTQSLEVAKKLRTKTLIICTGQEMPKVSRTKQHNAIVAALKAVAPKCEAAGVTLALEPLNTKVDHIGYYLGSTAEGFEIIDKVKSPAVKLLYDLYHMQIMEGDLIRTMTSNVDKIAHLHVADNPGRNEPGMGEINYPNVFAAIKKMDYTGYTGLEFAPTGNHFHAVKQALSMG